MTAPTNSGKTGSGEGDEPSQGADPTEAKPAGTPVPPRGAAKKKPNRPSASRTTTTGRSAATSQSAATGRSGAASPSGTARSSGAAGRADTASSSGATGRADTASSSGAAGRAGAAGRPAAGRPAPRTSAAKTGSGGARASTNRRQADWQARRRRNMIYSGVAVGVIIVVVGVIIGIKATSNSGSGNKNSSVAGNTLGGHSSLPPQQAGVSALPPSGSKVLNVPISALADASKGTTVTLLTGGKGISKQPPLTANGKPEILYIGAEFCPYCAAERWPMVAALAKFGTFTNLGTTASSGTDVNPNTPTFSFYGSTYTSKYITFTPVETTTQDQSVALQSPTAAQVKLWKALDPGQTIPFINFGNKSFVTGATFTSSSMSNQTFDAVAAQVGNNSTAAGKGIDQAAGAMIKQICALTNNQPANVCSAIGS